MPKVSGEISHMETIEGAVYEITRTSIPSITFNKKHIKIIANWKEDIGFLSIKCLIYLSLMFNQLDADKQKPSANSKRVLISLIKYNYSGIITESITWITPFVPVTSVAITSLILPSLSLKNILSPFDLATNFWPFKAVSLVFP